MVTLGQDVNEELKYKKMYESEFAMPGKGRLVGNFFRAYV